MRVIRHLLILSLPLFASTSFAEFSCKNFFSDLSAPTVLRQSKETTRSLEFPYESEDGHTCYYRDGVLWQLINNNWVHIGYGRYADGIVYEDQVNIPLQSANKLNGAASRSHLKSIRENRRYQVHISEGNRYYPNIESSFRSLIHSVEVGNHTIEIIVPKGTGYEHLAGSIVRTITELPVARIEALHTVRLNTRAFKDDAMWTQRYGVEGESAATGGNGQMDIYAVAIPFFAEGHSEALRITRHEFGHSIATQLFGSIKPSQQYIEGARRDGNEVSEYGRVAIAEDFAEAIEAYLRTNAGLLDANLRKQLLNRFNFLDDVFNYRSPQSLKALKTEIRKLTRKKKQPEVYVTMLDKSTFLVVAPQLGTGMLLRF